jgi:hypothetical protein
MVEYYNKEPSSTLQASRAASDPDDTALGSRGLILLPANYSWNVS